MNYWYYEQEPKLFDITEALKVMRKKNCYVRFDTPIIRSKFSIRKQRNGKEMVWHKYPGYNWQPWDDVESFKQNHKDDKFYKVR